MVTGSLGAGAAGRRLSEARSWSAEERDALGRFARPTPRVGEAAVLAARGATAMIDVSDGLALDLSRICAAGGVGARIELAEIPVHPAATLDEALGGGEDYELVATLPADAVDPAREELGASFGVPLTPIGAIIEEGLLAADEGGVERPLRIEGWDHFG